MLENMCSATEAELDLGVLVDFNTYVQKKKKHAIVCSSPLILFPESSLHPPSLFHIQPIIVAADGSLTCSQHAPFPAHVSVVDESPELTADGALWVDEARSVCSVHSPRNLSSFFSALLSPKTTEGTLDHHLMRHHLPYVLGGAGGDVSVLSLGLFIQGASGCSLTCSLDREPWGSA